MRKSYLLANVAKNAVAPLAIRLRPGRGSLGIDGDVGAVVRVLESLAPALAKTGGVAGRRVAELGPGRTIEVCAAMVLAGAESASGYDTTLQVPRTGIARRCGAIGEALCAGHSPHFVEAAGIDPAALRERAQDPETVAAALAFHRYDGAALPVAANSVDVIFSKSVLEHVPLRCVRPLLRETHRVLRDGGVTIHLIDLRDHMFIQGDDAVTGDWLDALRYPEPVFQAMFKNRSTAINRLRSTQWYEALASAGFEVIWVHERRLALPRGFSSSSLSEPWRHFDAMILEVATVTVAATPLTTPGASRSWR